MKKEKRGNMKSAEAGAHDLFVISLEHRRGGPSMETLELTQHTPGWPSHQGKVKCKVESK